MKFEKIDVLQTTESNFLPMPSFSSSSSISLDNSKLGRKFYSFYDLQKISNRFLFKFFMSKKRIQDDFFLNNTTNRFDNSFEIFDYYSFVRFSSFIDFFDKRNVDVPKCFVKVLSLRRNSFELLLLKFSNLLMKKGKKEKMIKNIVKTFYEFRNQTLTNNFKNWQNIYISLNSIFFQTTGACRFNNIVYEQMKYNSFCVRLKKISSISTLIENLLLKTMLIVQPLFHFSVYNVDKNLKKFNRNKQSKHVFIWKYVPLYKRKLVCLKIVIQDIKFNTGNKFTTRFLNSLITFEQNPKNSFAYKTNMFTNKYIFKNLKKSLLKNLKSTRE